MKIATFFLALSLAAVPAQGQQGGNPETPQIVTTGTGESQTTPDRARIDLTVETKGATAAAAAQENARVSTAVRARLRTLGLTDQQISTWGYTVHPEYDYGRNEGKPRIIGYVARNTVRADVRRIDQVGQVIDGAVAAGVNNVSGLDFYSSNLQSARQAALTQAVTRARADAEVMATTAGGRLGPLLELSSTYYAPPPMPYMARMEASMAAQADQTPINPGERTVMVTVNARWRFIAP